MVVGVENRLFARRRSARRRRASTFIGHSDRQKRHAVANQARMVVDSLASRGHSDDDVFITRQARHQSRESSQDRVANRLAPWPAPHCRTRLASWASISKSMRSDAKVRSRGLGASHGRSRCALGVSNLSTQNCSSCERCAVTLCASLREARTRHSCPPAPAPPGRLELAPGICVQGQMR